MLENSHLKQAVFYAVIGLALFGFALYSGVTFVGDDMKASVPGFSAPVDPNDSRFGCNPNGSWSDVVWCNNYGSSYEGHSTEAGRHAGKAVMFKRTLPNYGDYYVAGSYGDYDSASGLYAGSVVHCPSGSTIQYHLRSHMKYSPSLGEGYYDGDSHYWCEQNGVAVNPLPGQEDGKSMPDMSSCSPACLYKFTFPDTSGNPVNYYKMHKIGGSVSGLTNGSSWATCANGIAGPFIEGVNLMEASIYESETNKNRAKSPHYHCLGQGGNNFVDPIAGTAPPAPYDNTWNFTSGIMYTENLAVAAEKDVVGNRAPCPRDTYYCQSTSPDYRTCSSTPDCTGKFTPPAPPFTLGNPTNVKLDPSYHPAGTSRTFEIDDKIYFLGTLNLTGSAVPASPSKRFRVKVSTSATNFSSPLWTGEASSATNSATFGTLYPGFGGLTVGGPYYFCMEVAMNSDNSEVFNFESANQKTTCVVSSESFNMIAPVVSVCALSLKLNDGKSTYTKGDMVNYTYSCSPVGTRAASVAVQLVKPDGTSTVYNTATNVDTSTLGFSTSNLATGDYLLKACLDSACISGSASVSFTVKATTTTTTTTTVCGNGTCDSGETVAACPADCTTITQTQQNQTQTTTTTQNQTQTTNNGTTAQTYPSATTIPKSCGLSEICPQGSWCSNGRQCYYPDGSLTCIAWQSKGCPGGTNVCSPDDVKNGCIGPGMYGDISNGYCRDSMECYTTDGKQKFCQGYTNDPMTSSSCPSNMKLCSPSDKNCIEPGEYGPMEGWCKNSMECFIDGKKFCQEWSHDMTGGMTACPSGSNLCSPTDTKCIEPGKTGPVDGWCKDAMECYSADGKKKYCQKWERSGTAAIMTAMNPMICPSDYPKMCRPDDKNCIEIGATGPADGWCTGGGKQCYTGGGLYCAKFNEECPAGASVCRANDTNCVETGKYSDSNDGWCGGRDVAPCYKKDGRGMYCASFVNEGPWSWESATCPNGYGRCRYDDKYCMELGETGPADHWCTNGMSKPNEDGTITCVSSKEYMNGVTTTVVETKPKEEFCIQVAVTAYDPATKKCQMYSTPCKVPTDWKEIEPGKTCKDGLVQDVANLEDEKSVWDMVENDKSYLKNLTYQLKEISSGVDGFKEIEDLINKGLKLIEEIKKAGQDFAKNKKKILEIINDLHKNIMPKVEEKMAALQPYIQYSYLEKDFEYELNKLHDELSRIDKESTYYSELSTAVDKLENLMKSAQNQRGEGMNRLIDQINKTFEQIKNLRESRHGSLTRDFFADAIKNLQEDVKKMGPFFNNPSEDLSRYEMQMMTRLENMVEKLVGLYEKGEVNGEFKRMLAEATDLRDRLFERFTITTTAAVDVKDILKEKFDDKFIEQMVRDVVDKLTDKITVLLDEAMREIAVKITEIASVAAEKMVQSLSNLTSVPEDKRSEIAESKNNILTKIQKVEKMIADKDRQIAAVDELKAIIEYASTVNWCGTMAELVQSKINSMTLGLENNEFDASDIKTLKAEIEKLAEENNEACYMVGASNFRDTPMHYWYFGPTQYNSERGLIKGYANADGTLKGEFGPADPALRIEALAMAMRLFNISVSDGAVDGFNGVPEWGRSYVAGALKVRIKLDKTWAWDQPITRAESAELYAAVGGDNVELPSGELKYANEYKDYADFSADIDQVRAVDALTELEVFKGFEGRFNPSAPLLRSEFATVNMRMVENLGL